MEKDIKDVVKRLIQGNEKRKIRMRMKKGSEFDALAEKAIENALALSCGSIKSQDNRRHMQERVYRSIAYSIPYEYIGEAYCGRRQFYECRDEFIKLVAREMNMLPKETAVADGRKTNGSEYAR